MHVVILCKACVVGAYQRKLEEIAAHPDVTLTALVPTYWRDRRGTQRLERVYTRGYTLRAVPIRLAGSYHLHYYPTLGAELKRLQVDLLHIDEEPYNLATWQAMRLARQHNIPTLFFTWQNIFRRYPPPFSWFERYAYQHARFAIVGNEEALHVLRRKGYRGPARVLPQFGVDPEIFCPHPEWRSPDSPFTVGYAGGLLPEKGVDLLLEATAGLDGAWRLHLVGSGPYERRLRHLAGRLGIADRITWTPRAPSTEMPRVYHTFDVLVLPSRTRRNWKEQFGRVLIEAMACEIPVVGASSGEIPNVIGDAGLIFPEEDISTLRQHLIHLRADPHLRAELGRQGRERVLALYTQARIVAETVRIYRHILER